MGYFPFYIDIENKSCIVVGGGTVALRKIEKLMPFGPDITVIADEICDELAGIKGISIISRSFKDSDLNNAFMAIGATDSQEVNRHIFDLCRERNILVNCVDDKDNCIFIFPSLIKTENITVSISTEGKSPLYAKYLRHRIEEIIAGNCDETVALLADFRQSIKDRVLSEKNRKAVFEHILNECILGRKPSIEEVSKIIKEFDNEN